MPEMSGDGLGRSVDACGRSGDLVESCGRAGVEMVAAKLADEVGVDVAYRRNSHACAVENVIRGTPHEQVSGGHPIPRVIKKLRVEVEREPKWSSHDTPPHTAVARSLVSGSFEPGHRCSEIVRTDEKIDIGQRPFRGVVVEPMLEEGPLDRHHLDSGPSEPPRHVTDELGREHRGRHAAPEGVSVYCRLRHFSILPEPGIKQTPSVV